MKKEPRQKRNEPKAILLDVVATEKLCDVVIIGVRPDSSVMVRHSGTTLGSLLLFLDLARAEAMKAWDAASKQYAQENQGKIDAE